MLARFKVRIDECFEEPRINTTPRKPLSSFQGRIVKHVVTLLAGAGIYRVFQYDKLCFVVLFQGAFSLAVLFGGILVDDTFTRLKPVSRLRFAEYYFLLQKVVHFEASGHSFSRTSRGSAAMAGT